MYVYSKIYINITYFIFNNVYLYLLFYQITYLYNMCAVKIMKIFNNYICCITMTIYNIIILYLVALRALINT